MFIVLLRFSDKRALAQQFMEGHNAWLRRGFDDGVVLLAGSLQPQAGGAILVHNISRADLEMRLNEDPFVAADVVKPDILEVAASRADERLAFLLG
ncbi:YciI family protein [Methylocystis sp. Sn-Cys]|uniref:YciI family protein n=1 Tax=Methylocystis sp. Sn-Cys TaxID=1701263 RepID=UPI00192220B1|nr:hypothetical protein [Methylocystis sp. Sn-Cys]MBL1256372.1 hypothetical protein [Methylocystis sp. Sn-Cys]